MTKETDYLIQSIFERESLEEMTLDELQAMTEQFPYSSIIRYLHTVKLKETYDRHYPEAVSLTALYFTNPQWLYYQLSDEGERGGIKKFQLDSYDEEVEVVDEDEIVEGVEGVEGVEELKRLKRLRQLRRLKKLRLLRKSRSKIQRRPSVKL